MPDLVIFALGKCLIFLLNLLTIGELIVLIPIFCMSTVLSPVSAQDLSTRLEAEGSKPLLLDVRTAMEHRQIHIEGVRLIPLNELDAAALAKELGTDQEVVTICKAGIRAQKAAEKLAAAGMKEVRILQGGMDAWGAANLPANRSKGGIPLERQTRIIAGTVVLTGLALGHWVKPELYLISTFVGLGLIFSGLVGRCAMASLLARAPWNRAGAGGASGGSCCS